MTLLIVTGNLAVENLVTGGGWWSRATWGLLVR